MATITIKLEDVTAQDLAVLSHWLDSARAEMQPCFAEKRVVEQLQDAIDDAEAKQYLAERIEV